MNKREDFKQLVRYGVVGVANTLLTFVSYWIFRYITGNVDLANGVSYALGMVCSFLLNKRWTFNAGGGRWRREACFFSAVRFCAGVCSGRFSV